MSGISAVEFMYNVRGSNLKVTASDYPRISQLNPFILKIFGTRLNC